MLEYDPKEANKALKEIEHRIKEKNRDSEDQSNITQQDDLTWADLHLVVEGAKDEEWENCSDRLVRTHNRAMFKGAIVTAIMIYLALQVIAPCQYSGTPTTSTNGYSPNYGLTPGTRTYTLIHLFENDSKTSSCDGIELFYTGKNFYDDWRAMRQEYKKIHNTGLTDFDGYSEWTTSSKDHEFENLSIYSITLLYMGVDFKLPKDIRGNSTNFDCEDFGHVSMCLGMKYDVECRLWWEEVAGRMDGQNYAHIGVCCDVPHMGWTCY